MFGMATVDRHKVTQLNVLQILELQLAKNFIGNFYFYVPVYSQLTTG